MIIHVVCGWCKLAMGTRRVKQLPAMMINGKEVTRTVSHGICDACRAKHFPEVETSKPIAQGVSR